MENITHILHVKKQLNAAFDVYYHEHGRFGRWWPVLGVWCLTPLSSIFQLYRGEIIIDVLNVLPIDDHWGHRARHGIFVGFTFIYVISANHQ
jgi:hypothetical protein